MKTRWQTLALRAAGVYGLTAALWIVSSDLLALSLAGGSQQLVVSIGKGLLFVFVTSVLLYVILARVLRRECELRLKAEETARELAELRTIAEHSGEVFYKHDRQHRFTYVNPRALAVLGYEVGELGRTWTELLTDNPVNQEAKRRTEQALKTGDKQPPYLVEIRKKTGEPVLLEVEESPLKDSTGEVVALVGAARDVTEREKAQRQLRESEKLFRRLADAISEVFWIQDPATGKVQYVSPAYERVWGRSCQSLYDDPGSWADSIHPDDRPRALEGMRRALIEEPTSVEYRILHSDGTVRWILDRAFPARKGDEMVGLVGIAKDITERKQNEQALLESEKLYRTVFAAASEGIFILEHDRFLDCNAKALELYGVARQDFMGKGPLEFSPATQPDGQSSSEKGRDLARRALRGEPQTFQWKHLRRDGELFSAEVNLRGMVLGSRRLLVGVVRDITDRLRAEEALRDSEERFRGLYASMNEGMALHEMVYGSAGEPVNYRILEVNPAYEAITGFARSGVVGKLASEAYGLDQVPHLEIFGAVVRSREPVQFETFFEPGGKDLAISVFSPRAGQFATVFSDITKRKHAERQIRLLNQLYAVRSRVNEMIVRASEAATLLTEACRIAVGHGGFRMAWAGMKDGGGWGIMAQAGHTAGFVEAVTAIGSEAGRGDPAQSAAADGHPVLWADLRDTQPGVWRDEALRRGYGGVLALPLRQGGKVVAVLTIFCGQPGFLTAVVAESLVEVAADISFALDLIKRNRERELEQQQLRLQHTALEAAANAIVITDRRGRIEWVNEAFTRLTGYSREAAIGQNSHILRSGKHPSSFYESLWVTVLAGKVWRGTLTNKRKDGTFYEEEMVITPVRATSGEVEHFIAIKQDITERRKLEQQFLRAQRMQSIGLLAGGVAHDLNNVLAPVLMALPLLRSPLSAEHRDQMLQALERSVQRGASIVQQVLTFARGVEVQRVTLQPKHLVRDLVKIAEETFPRNIRVRSNLPEGLWPLNGDPTQLHQVLLNLAVNARDAMPDGGQLVFAGENVELTESREFQTFEIGPGPYVTLTVSDTGSGVAPEVLERIFEPFFTTKPAGKGTGLGLSTVLGIVRSHGGLVEVQTAIGAGSSFRVYLPAVPKAESSALASSPAQVPKGQGETVLVVDDEEAILGVTRSNLLAAGYRVIVAPDGVQALARFAEHRHEIRAVITDIMMPVMDGVTLARRVRALNAGVAIIASTGLLNAPGEEDRAVRLRELGVRRFLRKPFQTDELLRTLHQALQECRQAGF